MEIIAFALALMFTGYVWKPVDRRSTMSEPVTLP